MKKINIQYYKTPIGELILGSYEQKLCLLDFAERKTRDRIDNRIQTGLRSEYVNQDDDVLTTVRQQIDEYLNDRRDTFDIPLMMIGTDFQKSVWRALMDIPYGTTASYLQLAQHINKEKAVRAVANANGSNAMSLIIPCHRIIGSNGNLVGYAGGLSAKEYLLKLES